MAELTVIKKRSGEAQESFSLALLIYKKVVDSVTPLVVVITLSQLAPSVGKNANQEPMIVEQFALQIHVLHFLRT